MDNISMLPENYYSRKELNNLLRLLLSQNTMWTRNYIVSYISGIEDLLVIKNRLLENATDIKNVFGIYYIKEISAFLEFLLRDYTNNMIGMAEALKTYGNIPQKISEARRDWIGTGRDIAEFLYSINPYWHFNKAQTIILDHIEMTISQMEERLRGEYALEVYQYDFIEYHSLMMGDFLSKGIIYMFYPG